MAFNEQERPSTPHYSRESAWAILPGRLDPSTQAPGGGRALVGESTVDVFYVHPTTFRSDRRWNQDLSDVSTNRWTDLSVIARQASIFNRCCRLFAPRYRQASSAAFGSADGDRAYALAYQDVASAFEYYLDHYNKGRPFILVGHSQGALHIYRLVSELIDRKGPERQFVAAYAAGVPVSLEVFGRQLKSVQPCLKPLQTGCIASWNSLLGTADAPAYTRRIPQAYVQAHTGPLRGSPFCVNPLTFDIDRPSASARDNAGSLPWPPAAGSLPSLRPGAVGARCSEGVLKVDVDPATGFRLDVLAGGSLHMQDLDLFYEALGRNAAARAAAFTATAPRGPGGG